MTLPGGVRDGARIEWTRAYCLTVNAPSGVT